MTSSTRLMTNQKSTDVLAERKPTSYGVTSAV